MRIAEIFIRQNKLKEAGVIAEKIAKTADETDLRSRAERLVAEIRQREEIAAQNEEARKRYEKAGTVPSDDQVIIRRRPGEEKPTAEQIAKAEASARMRALNQSLRPLGTGETQVLGKITKIDCSKGDVTYAVKTESESFVLTSKDFRGLAIITFIPDAGDTEVGCKSNVGDATAILSYRPSANVRTPIRGELVAIQFVPKDFRFIDLSSEPKSPTYVIEETGPSPEGGESAEERRSGLMEAIRNELRKPAAGEKREIGYIERTECSAKGIFFYIKTATQILKLGNSSPQAMATRAFTPDVDNLQMGCGMKQVEIPVVFIYKDAADTKAKVAGDLVSLEFVPKSFTLN